WWTRVDGRMSDEFAIVSTQNVEAAVLATGADDPRLDAVQFDGEDFGRVAYRLILVQPGLRIIGAHRIGPHVARVDLRVPSALAAGGIERDDRTRVRSVEVRIVGGRLPRC